MPILPFLEKTTCSFILNLKDVTESQHVFLGVVFIIAIHECPYIKILLNICT